MVQEVTLVQNRHRYRRYPKLGLLTLKLHKCDRPSYPDTAHRW
jgi:hypothetical protein